MVFVAGQKVRASELNDLALKGRKGVAFPPASGSCTTSETIQTETVTINVVAGRWYRITHTQQFTIGSGSPTAQTHRYRVLAGGTLTTSGTLIREYIGPPPNGAWQTATYVSDWLSTFTGQATFGCGWFVNAGTGSAAGGGRQLAVDDLGT